MKISVIGAGNIGGTLGSKWAARGHEVVFGVRDPGAAKVGALLARAGEGARAVAVAEAAAEAEAVLFAVPSATMAETVARLSGDLQGKILIDASNNVGQTPMHQLALLSKTAPGSALFRAFSNLGWENFAEPQIDGQQVDLFYCGQSGKAQEVMESLIADIGLRPIFLGGVEQAEIVDALTRLWFTMVRQGRGRHLAFKMLAET